MKYARNAILSIATMCLMSNAVWAQKLQVEPIKPAQQVAPAAPEQQGGIKSQSIFEVKPDASADPNYAKQTNAERNKVQPGSNTPMWRQVGQGATGVTTLPYSQAPEAGNMIQRFVQYPGSSLTNAGEAWRQVRNNWIIPYGGSLILIALVALGLFYWRKGTIELHGHETGKKIERFTYFERAAHWTNAIAFCCLAISGIIMGFGKFFLLPIIGGSLFGWLTFALKNLHNFVGPLFAVSLIVVIVTFIRDNLPSSDDIKWILKGGGLFSGEEVPSHRFNAGEKIVFWGGVFLLGLIVVGSGLVLDKLIPGLMYYRETMQISHMIHASASMLMVAMFLGHIYMGTIGMRGAYKAMKTGYVDETWAKEHHALWAKDIATGKIPAQRTTLAAASSTPANVSSAQA